MAVCERGIELCQQGEWRDGLVDLAWLVKGKQAKKLPGRCYSYLGYGMAKTEKKVEKGRKFCKHGIKVEWFHPDNYYNLARTCMLHERYRQEAWEAVRDGLKIDSDHEGLKALSQQLGKRKSPVLPFLSRGNILNRIFGFFRYQLTRSRGKKAAAMEEMPKPSPDSVIVS
jgi:hypothetical protein